MLGKAERTAWHRMIYKFVSQALPQNLESLNKSRSSTVHGQHETGHRSVLSEIAEHLPCQTDLQLEGLLSVMTHCDPRSCKQGLVAHGFHQEVGISVCVGEFSFL